MEEEQTSGILRQASIIRIKQVKETLAKKVATHTSEVIYSMECNHRNCENRGKERTLSDFQFGFVKNERESTVGDLSFSSSWWCCDVFMCEVEAACLTSLYQYFSPEDVEIVPDYFYQ